LWEDLWLFKRDMAQVGKDAAKKQIYAQRIVEFNINIKK
jgi:hypothetical protein